MSATATTSGTTRKIQLECSNEEKEEQLYNYYLTAYGVIMRRFICEDIIPKATEKFRLERIKTFEKEVEGSVKHKQKMIDDFKKFQDVVPSLNLVDFETGECPIVRKMSLWVDEFVVDVSGIIKKDLALNFIEKENGELTVNANVKKIKEFCSTYILGEFDGKYQPMWDYIHDYIQKQEGIILAMMEENTKAVSTLFKHKDIVEEKVVTKSKSQLKKEKAREANKRREQEKADKIKRQEKEAKYLEQKRKEAERKRIAVCRAKRK